MRFFIMQFMPLVHHPQKYIVKDFILKTKK